MQPTAAIDLATAALLGFYLLVGAYCIFSAILYYHWTTYATSAQVARRTLIAYFAVTVPLLAFMGFTTLAV